MDGGEYDEQYNVFRVPDSMIYYLMGNMSGSSIWSDVNFRKAVFYALDNNVISSANNLPACESATTAKWKDFAEAWAEDESYITVYDPELAAEYLAESGYNGETLTLVTQSEEVFKNTAIMVQTLLEQIGVHVEISAVVDTELSAITSTGDGYDMLISRSGGPSLIGSYNKMFNTADFVGNNSIGMLSDNKLFELYAIANTAEGFNVENMTTLRDYVIENAYCDFMTYNVNSWVYSSKIAEVGTNYVDQLRLGDCIYYLD